VTRGPADGGGNVRTAITPATIGGSFAYGFVIGLIASIIFEGFDIASNLLQAAIFGLIFTVVHIGFRLLRFRR
jgi:hypothetical protein